MKLTAENLRGNWATLLLPVNDDDSIAFDRLGEEVDLLIEAGVDGIYSNGTAGEFHNQTEAEFDAIHTLLAEKCRKRSMPFQIGASNPSPVISLERIRRSVALQPDAYQVILPDWVVPQPDEMLLFLHKIAEAANGIPLVLYNPPHAKLVLQPRDFGWLKKHLPQLIGIKTGVGDAAWYAEMRTYGKYLSVFVPGHFLATGCAEGVAAGAYSNVACINPAAAQNWWQLIQTDAGAAMEIQNRILEFFDRCIVPFKNAGYSNPALDKFLATVGGWANVGTRLRWPYRWIAESEVAKARRVALELLPEFFSSQKQHTHSSL